MNIAYLEFRLSGGASNSDPNLALGGVESSIPVRGRVVSGVANITGLTVLDALDTALGAATLAYAHSTHLLTLTGSSGIPGTGVNISVSGRYIVKSSSGQALTIEVDSASLPGSDQTDSITIATLSNALFDNVDKVQSFYGSQEYRCVYVHNTHPTEAFYDLKAYINTIPSGGDTLALAWEGAEGTTAQAIVTEHTPPTGLTFLSPLSSISGVQATRILAGSSIPLWIRRTVPAGMSAAAVNDISCVGLRAGY